ncbi:MAG: hypothetical protein ACTSRG_18675 [Candidatus Helarchaeota archaeon]
MVSYSFIYFTISLMILVISSINFIVLYYYKLYKLTKYSDVWRPFKRIFLGTAGLIFGMIIMIVILFHYLLTTFPDLFADAFYNYENIFAIGTIISALIIAAGVPIIIYGLRKFYLKMEKMVVEASQS